jgi:hypothetical protein
MLRRAALMDVAATEAGLDDFGDVPFSDALDALLASLAGEAGLDQARADVAALGIVRLLVKRLRLVDDRKRFPAIANEAVHAPIVIVGLPRTGSTHLHALLGEVEGIRTPRFWEMSLPSPPPDRETFGTDPRIALVEAELGHTPAELQVRHPFAARRPEQCNLLHDWAFINQTPIASYHVPCYRDWVLDADHAPAYEAHLRTLQHLQWRTGGRWALKYPKHLFSLDTLLATYPDAVLVWTHRDPAVVVPSACSLTSYMRELTTGTVDRPRFGREWAVLEELAARRGVSVRDRSTPPVIDVHYHELMADPVGTVGAVLDFAEAPFNDRSRAAVEAFLSEDARARTAVHRYSAEEFGLSRAGLHRRFGWYIERFGVRVEEGA